MSRLLADARVVVWDWNGTLLDDTDHCVDVVRGMLREEGLPLIDVGAYRDVFDFPVRAYYERLGFDLSNGRFETLAIRFIEAYDRGSAACNLHDGAAALLGALGERGVESSILTAARRHSVEAELALRGIRGLLTDVVGLADHYAGGKVELGVSWLASRAIAREEVVLVGDTLHDHEVARAMGVRCVLVAAGHHSRERLELAGCPVASSLAELVAP
jgi:phosphoglycolate phosphatase